MLALLFLVGTCAFAFAFAYRCALLASRRLSQVAYRSQQLRLEDVLRDRTLCLLLFCAFVAVIAFAVSPFLLIPGIVVALALSKRAPALLDARQARKLRVACDGQLDTMADIVAMGVRSGLSFDASLDLYCDKFDNELSNQLRRARLEWASGLASRERAFDALSDRVQSKALRRFSETAVQAIHHGSPLADMLARFSDEIRRSRHASIEQQIAKAPVKLLVPTGTCILPAMLILIMGPVLLQFTQTSFQ